jgi:hypothetical protein
VTVHQAIEYASACRLADGRRNSGNRRVSVVLDIHILIIDELFPSGNWYTLEYAANRALTPSEKAVAESIEVIWRRSAAALSINRPDDQEDTNDDNLFYPL